MCTTSRAANFSETNKTDLPSAINAAMGDRGFINQADIDEFLDLVRQRNIVVDRMKALPETEVYRQTEECTALVEQIKPLDMQVIYKAKSWLNKSRQQNATVRAYDLQSFDPVGNIVNRKY